MTTTDRPAAAPVERRYRRPPVVRAYRDRRGGWTLVPPLRASRACAPLAAPLRPTPLRTHPAAPEDAPAAAPSCPPVWRLSSPAACLLWEALEEGTSASELIELLARRFPQVDRARLERDMAAFLDSLDHAGLLEPARGVDRPARG